jgi:hypothetical protein
VALCACLPEGVLTSLKKYSLIKIAHFSQSVFACRTAIHTHSTGQENSVQPDRPVVKPFIKITINIIMLYLYGNIPEYKTTLTIT